MNAKDTIWQRLTMILAALLAAGAIAGCVDGTEETGEEPLTDDGVGAEDGVGADDDLGAEDDGALDEGVGDEQQDVEDVVIISGAVYECDTFLEATNEVEGACDEYQLNENEDATAFAGATEAEVVDQETVTINGQTYVCDNDGLEDLWDDDEAQEQDEVVADEATAEPCDEYVIASAAAEE